MILSIIIWLVYHAMLALTMSCVASTAINQSRAEKLGVVAWISFIAICHILNISLITFISFNQMLGILMIVITMRYLGLREMYYLKQDGKLGELQAMTNVEAITERAGPFVGEAVNAGESVMEKVTRPKKQGIAEREKEVLRLLKEGLTNEEIAKKLDYSLSTINKDIKRLKDNGLFL